MASCGCPLKEVALTKFCIKRIYEEASKTDGFRVLVDRLWPRGVSKEHAALDEWRKDLAPSTELRKWFDHDPAKFEEFSNRYRNELADNPEFAAAKKEWKNHPKVTLLYGAKDEEHNEAAVLLNLLDGDD